MTVGPLTIPQAQNKYYPTSNDKDESKGELLPEVKGEGKVFYYIDGERYLRRVYGILDTLQNSSHFFYFTAWDSKFFKESTTDDELLCVAGDTSFHLGNLLIKKAKAGVRIAGLLWLNPAVGRLLFHNAAQVYLLRDKEENLKGRILLNRRAHPFGAQHIKIVVAYDGTTLFGLVGGMDLIPNRLSDPAHTNAPLKNFWHDVAVEIRGPPAELVHKTFKQLWEHTEKERTPITNKVKVGEKVYELKDPPSSTAVILDLPSSLKHPEKGPETVQFLRTLPQFRKLPESKLDKMRKDGNWDITIHGAAQRIAWPWCKPYDFAPQGEFSFKVGLKAAIRGAEDYIYIEDQYFWSTEVMDWLNAALKDPSRPNLKVVLVTSGWIDPADKPMEPFYAALSEDAAKQHLLNGLNASQSARVGYFIRNNVTVHAKLCIIDDNWACIGSANIARRSLYTDIELSVSVITQLSHDIGYPEVPGLYEYKRFAKKLRMDLWAHHHNISDPSILDNIDRALTLWGFPGPSPLTPSSNMQNRVFTPSPVGGYTSDIRRIADADSREEY